MQTATDRIALITGANKGIGLEIARQLCKAACKVLVGARNAALGGAAAETLRAEGIDSRAITLDVTMPVTIQAAAAIIKAEHGRLDILVNTAGVTSGATDGPPSKADINTVRRVLETNFFGVLAVTQAMVPLLRNAASARVVNVSSGLGSLTHNGDPEWEFAGAKFIGYNTSKAALNMLTVQLAAELREAGIKVNAADPGFIAADLNDHRGYQTIPEGAATAVRLALLADEGPTGGFFSAARQEPW